MLKLPLVKYYSVLLGLCFAAIPLYAQVHDTVYQKQAPGVQQQYQPAPQQQYQPAPQPLSQPAQQYASPPPQVPLTSPQNDFLKGKIDGEQEGKAVGTGIWVLIGCATPIWAYTMDPEPPSSMALMGKSMEYVQGYNVGYKKAVKANRVKKSWIGCLVGWLGCCLIYLIIDLIVASSAASTSSS